MADNTILNSGTGGDTIATDDVTTLNGAGSSGVKVQRVKAMYGVDGSATDVSTTNPLPTKYQDALGNSPDVLAYGAGYALETALSGVDYIASTNNSSTAQLASTATFTGTIESAFYQPNISLLLTSDQPITLTIQQFIDSGGTRALPNIVFTGVTSISQSLVLNGNYVRVTAQNTGASTTTTFSLNVAYGTIPNANSQGQATMDLVSVGGVAIVDQSKGIQAASFLPVQQPKDTGRNTRIFMLDTYTAAPVAEALQSVVQWYGNAAVAATTTPAVVPAGKVLRITQVTMSTKSLATVGSAVLRIRANTAGTAVIGSPLVWSCECGSRAGATTTAMTGGLDTITINIPDGLEFAAGTGLGFTLAGYGPTGTLTLEGVTRFVVTGFEY